jgi:hypothetical protein
MSRNLRKHEWAWGDVGVRTVCGLMAGYFNSNLEDHTVHDLGVVGLADRCKNCERMRAAIGTSRKLAEPAA